MMLQSDDRQWRRFGNLLKCSVGIFALGFMPLAVGGCSNTDNSRTETAIAREAVDVANCGYALTTEVKSVNKKGFKAKIKVSDTSGGRLQPFTVLVNAGSAELVKVAHGTFQKVQNGYLLSTISPDQDCRDDEFDDDPTEDEAVTLGKKYRFGLKFSGSYTQLSTFIISANGVNCDQTAPTVKLTPNGSLFTSNGTLTLNADASDDVAVAKVVFSQDDVPIGQDSTAPYSLDVPLTNALNGRHRYSATAYDLTGNQALESKRVLVAIGNKFFGTAAANATDYSKLATYFNQITPGNAGKWGSVEAVQDQMNWTDLDTAYNFAKANNLRFKLHTLIWGQQQPSWIANLPADQQLAQIDQWMSELAARYPNIDLIDVVNEPLHAPPSYAEALGGAGTTGWDWVIKAFEMARAHFPNSELLINDYSILTMASSTQSYLTLVNLLNDRGLLDGIGEQGHFYERAPELPVLTSNLNALTATGLPVYISELDINFADDARQAIRMSQLFSTFWSNPSVLGITHWGYLQGNMWQTNAYLVRTDGTSRPALTWIQCCMAGGTDCPVPTYVPQPRTGDASGITLEAEDYDSAHALLPAGNVVAYAGDGSWLGYNQVTFNSNWNTLNVAYALGSASPISLTVHLGSLDNAPVATVPLAPTGGWSTTKTASIPWSATSGVQDVYVRFNGGGANIDKFQFAAPTGTGKNIIANGTFESGTSGWNTWNGGSLSASTARAHTGAQSLLVSNRAANAPAATDVTSAVKAGSNYPLSLWVSINTTDGTASKKLNMTQAVTCTNADGTSSTSYSWIGGQVTVPSDGSWVQMSGSLAVLNCALKQVQFWVEGDTNADIYVDDVQLIDNSGGSTNLMSDGTFESGVGAWGGWGYSSLSVVSTQAHSGTYSLVGASMTANSAIARDIKALVTPGKRYQATASVTLGSLSAAASVKWQTVQNCNSDTSDSYPWLAGASVTPGTWTQLTGVVDLTACTAVNKLLLFAGADSGDLYVDDVTLTPLP